MSRCRPIVLALILVVLASLPAAAQVAFPRIGVSVAIDHYVDQIPVYGDETFDLHVIALPPDGQDTFEQEFGQFQWLLLEACCGGAAIIVDAVYNPALEHQGSPYAGMIVSSEECMSGESVWLATLTLQMTADVSGLYFVNAGPTALALTCAGDGVVMTDMPISVDYTAPITSNASTTLSEVKAIFD